MRGTIQLNSEGIKVFVPDLPRDLFSGILKPNINHIDKAGIAIPDDMDKDLLEEGSVLHLSFGN